MDIMILKEKIREYESQSSIDTQLKIILSPGAGENEARLYLQAHRGTGDFGFYVQEPLRGFMLSMIRQHLQERKEATAALLQEIEGG